MTQTQTSKPGFWKRLRDAMPAYAEDEGDIAPEFLDARRRPAAGDPDEEGPASPKPKPAPEKGPPRPVSPPSTPTPPVEDPDDDDTADIEPPADEPDKPGITPPPNAPPVDPVNAEAGWASRLRAGLGLSQTALGDGISGLFSKRRLDRSALDDLEDVLIRADLGPAMSARITDRLARGRYDKGISENDVRRVLADEIENVLTPVARPYAPDITARPHVALIVGVNGSGKTTTIGKLAKRFAGEGRKVLLAAGDTFRAAAIEQLGIWGERTGAAVVAHKAGSDPAGVAFEAMERAKAEGFDLVLVDTAGRLQNRADLMAGLAKIVRVLKKQDETAPHSVILVLDATTGQNAISQVEAFRETAGVTGLIVTKLDGSARGGVLVAIADRFGLPVHAIGIGEQAADMQPFDPRDFAAAIAGLDLAHA